MTTLPFQKIRAYGLTDRGLIRDCNEDSLFLDHERQIFAVADGLGGLPEGAVASDLAVEVLARVLESRNGNSALPMVDLFLQINRAVYERGQAVSHEFGIGTTLTVAQIWEGQLHLGHVGDSGLVLFRLGDWRQLTSDHTMAQEMRDQLRPGERAYIPEYFSHTLTRCIGQGPKLEVETLDQPLQAGDRIILFSDGLTKTMEWQEVQAWLEVSQDPEDLVEKIIDTANQRGGPDNTTAVAVYID